MKATVAEVLKKLTIFLSKKNIVSPRIEAEYIISHVLSLNKMIIYCFLNRTLKESEIQLITKISIRRAKKEPLQYIIGHINFCDFKLKVDKRALIPRPETEEFIDIINKNNILIPPNDILDLGCGSGVISIALAKKYPNSKISAIDCSEQSLSLAKENILLNNINNINLLKSYWFNKLNKKFDIIASNPPYLSKKEWGECQREVKNYEPYNALVSKKNGIHDLIQIIQGAFFYLKKDGLLALETGILHHTQLSLVANKIGYKNIMSLKDFQNLPRFFLAYKR